MKVKSLSRVRLSATPWTVAYQASPSMGFSRQQYWSGLPFPSLRLPIAVFKFSFISYFSLSFSFLFWVIFLTLFSKLSMEFNFCSFIKTIFKKIFLFCKFSFSLFKKKKKCGTQFWSPLVQRPLVLPFLEEKSPVSFQVGILAVLLQEIGRQIWGTYSFLS